MDDVVPEKPPVPAYVQAQQVDREHAGNGDAKGFFRRAAPGQGGHAHHQDHHQRGQLQLHPDPAQPPGDHLLKGVAVLPEEEDQHQSCQQNGQGADDLHRIGVDHLLVGHGLHKGSLHIGQGGGGASRELLQVAGGIVQGAGISQHHQEENSRAAGRAENQQQADPGEQPRKGVAPGMLSAFQICIQCPTPPLSIPARWD